MASKQTKKTTASGRSNYRSQGTRSTSGRTEKNNNRRQTEQESALFHEVSLILLFAAAVFLFLCNFGIIGTVGNAISSVLFGLFGLLAYVVSIVIFLLAAFWSANAGSYAAARKIVAACTLFLMAGVVCEMISGIRGFDLPYYIA